MMRQGSLLVTAGLVVGSLLAAAAERVLSSSFHLLLARGVEAYATVDRQTLFGPQRRHRVNRCRPARRQKSSGARGGQENGGDHQHNRWIDS